MPKPPPGTAPDTQEADTRALFRELEACTEPSAREVDLLLRNALLFARLGFAERGKALLKRWREDGVQDPDLALAELHLTVSPPSAAAVQRLKSIGAEDPQTCATEVANCVFRGEIKRGVDLARASGWFLDHVECLEAVTFALLGLALSGGHVEAQGIIEAWKQRHAQAAPQRYQLMLRFESRMAAFQYRFPRALDLMLDAWALGERYGLDATLTMMEPNLATAYAHCELLEDANAIHARWPPHAPDAHSPLDGFRTRARMELALIEARYDDAYRYANDLMGFYKALNNAALTCGLLFTIVQTAPAARFAEDLEAFRRATWRYQIPYYLHRLTLLERLQTWGARSVRDTTLLERSRDGVGEVPLARLWVPPARCLAADVYWDRARGVLLLSGVGPHEPHAHPVLHRMLETILAQPRFELPVAALFEAVWDGRYNPLVHEGKVHVTVHRLRRWLAQQGGASSELIRVRDGVVGFDPRLHVRVVEPAPCFLPSMRETPTRCSGVGPTLRERVLQCLSGGEPVAPRELERQLEISRSSLNMALRCLQVEGAVERVGKGRATRYRVAPATT